MIAHIEGRLVSKSSEGAVVDVNGVGYYLFVPLTTFYNLPEPGERVLLQTHTYVREDALRLFGFLSHEEKRLFEFLLKVSKVGPRLACNILSGLSSGELERAIGAGDVAGISAIPGVGKKTAERIVIELQDKIGKSASADMVKTQGAPAGQNENDAVTALVNLGYKQTISQKAVKKVLAERGGVPLRELLKEALKLLGKL